VQKPLVLVVAEEDVISALLGAMVELDGYQPIFPAADELPLDTIRRIRPALVLLDGEHELAWDADAMRTLRELRVQAMLVSALRSQQELEMLAARHDVPSLALPVRFREFATQLEKLITQQVS
jgi:DNA-binding response OmpR family regulator